MPFVVLPEAGPPSNVELQGASNHEFDIPSLGKEIPSDTEFRGARRVVEEESSKSDSMPITSVTTICGSVILGLYQTSLLRMLQNYL